MIATMGISRLLQAQETDSVYYAENEATSLKFLKSEALIEQEKRENKEFIREFKIDLTEYSEAIVLAKTRIKSSSNTEEGHDVANVEVGSVVKAYKHCKKNKSWAVKYKNKWGFLPESVLQEL